MYTQWQHFTVADGLPSDHIFAVRADGDQVWVMTEEGTLNVRDVVVPWSDGETVLISEGLNEGDLLITSALAAPAPGMLLRTMEPDRDE